MKPSSDATSAARRPPNLRATAARGLRWSVSARLLTQLVQWAATLVIIRLLDPGAYGLMALATVAISWSAMISDLGLTASVMRAPMSHEALASLQGAIVGFNLCIFMAIFTVAPTVSAFYATDVTNLLRVLAVGFVLESFGRIQEAILIREMKFKTRSIIESTSSLVEASVTIILAWTGFGVWALVIGSIIRALARCSLFSLAVAQRIVPSHRIDLAWPHIRFGLSVTLARTLNWLSNSVDVFILGRLFDVSTLGLYNVGKNLALLPVTKLGSTLTPLGFSVYAKLIDDRQQQRVAVLEAAGMVLVISTPAAALIAALAPEIQAVLLGARWHGVELTLAVMSFAIPLMLVGSQLNSLLMATGTMRPVVVNQLIALGSLAVGIWVGSWWGLRGATLGWSLAYLAAWLIGVARTRTYTLVGVLDLVGCGRGALIGSALLYGVVVASRSLVGGTLPQIALLPALAAIGALVYFATLLLIGRESLAKVVKFLWP